MRVLVVEDAARLANWIAEGLRDQGIAVDIAYDGTEAANKLDLNPYDVVVLDRDLPGIHGDTLCRMIIDSDDPAMILMLTAASAPGERVAGLTLGADDYLPKPFHFPELVLRVRALARRKPTAQPHMLRACGIELDPRTGLVNRDGRPIDLTPKERAVLEALLRASPAALTQRSSSNRPGTKTPTRSPPPSRSQSAGYAANSETPRSSKRRPASAIASQPAKAIQAPRPTRRDASHDRLPHERTSHEQTVGPSSPALPTARASRDIERRTRFARPAGPSAGDVTRPAPDPAACSRSSDRPERIAALGPSWEPGVRLSPHRARASR